MDLDTAKKTLSTAIKGELRDHAFGDCEVTWYIEGENVGFGYFGSGEASVSVLQGAEWFKFVGEDAHTLRECCASEKMYRNDETGPDDFVEGQIMIGLTSEFVRAELED